MMIKYPIYIYSYNLFQDLPDEDETEFLSEAFSIFNHQHVIEAYKEVQQKYPDLFPPLLEKQ